jgi:hypothetical protein
MECVNKANGAVIRNLTAKKIMYLSVEGVNLYANPAVWRRVAKRQRKAGLLCYAHTKMYDIDIMAVDIAIQEADRSLEKEVAQFLEDMYIMGMLEDSHDDD